MVVESRPSKVDVRTIQGQVYFSVRAIDAASVAPNQTITSNPIDISNFRTKTISGYSEFNGTIKIYVAPTSDAAAFYPYPYYSADISSGTTFSFSFTEAFALVKVEVTNTSTAAGNIVVYATMSVL